MCDTCGCQLTDTSDTLIVEVNKNLLEANNRQGEANQSHIERMGAVAINLISSPGGGKTTLLEHTIDALGDVRIGVIEGDIETERDADRIRAKGVAAVQLTTGGACHLDAPMVHKGLHALEDQANEKKEGHTGSKQVAKTFFKDRIPLFWRNNQIKLVGIFYGIDVVLNLRFLHPSSPISPPP